MNHEMYNKMYDRWDWAETVLSCARTRGEISPDACREAIKVINAERCRVTEVALKYKG